MNFTITDVTKACRGELISGSSNLELTGVSTDTRTIKKGDLFVALKGPFFDGHDYCAGALKRGAGGLLLSKKIPLDSDVPCVLVDDSVKALGDLAAWWRAHFSVPCVAITGSNGKSTTKEMTSAVAQAKGEVLKTVGNFNNLIGLPLTIFHWEAKHAVAVLEMGMNAPGEISRLTKIASPTVGIITNVTAAHLEKLGDIEAVADAKGELFVAMERDRIAIINEEDPYVSALGKKFKGEKITFGMQNGSDVRFLHMETRGLEEMQLRFSVRGEEHRTRLKVVGVHNVMNALASVAVGLSLGISPKESSELLSSFEPMKMRFEQIQLKNGVRMVNDSYNANPASMRASLRTVSAARRSGRFIAVLGDMLELGEDSKKLHYELGRDIPSFGVNKLSVVGKFSVAIEKGARDNGLKDTKHFEGVEDLLSSVENELKQGDVLLVKGSRGMRMEKLVDYLKEKIGVD